MARWTRLELIGLITSMAAIAGIAVTLILVFDPFGWKNAEIEIVGDAPAAPAANGRTVIVPIHNRGMREAAVRRIELRPEHWIQTPFREPIYGAGPPIYAYFEERHWNASARAYSMKLEPPASVPAGEFAALSIAIIDPTGVGWTCAGEVVVTYDDGATASYEVEVDVLEREPGK